MSIFFRQIVLPILLVAGSATLQQYIIAELRDRKTPSVDETFVESSCNKPLYECIRQLVAPKTVLVTGGAGFIGSHLVDNLMIEGNQVIVVDDLSTGNIRNIEHWLGSKNFRFIEHDVEKPLNVGPVTEIFHLASPASPRHYMKDPIKTIMTITLGASNLLEFAEKSGARIVIASTSEVYGDPLEHPQHEGYWGNTNPIGPRSCYDEAKRLSESLATAYSKEHNVSVGIARIFNTYGPRMDPHDGRVVSNFVIQALHNNPITIYGTGNQTRSFQYITDLIFGLRKLMLSNITSPINLGYPEEITISELASRVMNLVPHSSSAIHNRDLPVDDPHRRRPNILKARKLLDWAPSVELNIGLNKTINYFKKKTMTYP